MARAIGGEELSRIASKEHNNQDAGKKGMAGPQVHMGPRPGAGNPTKGNGINRSKSRSKYQ